MRTCARVLCGLAITVSLALGGSAFSAIGHVAAQTVKAEVAFPIQVTDATGRKVTVRSTERMVVLNGHITEIVYALGLGGQVVGADVTSVYPEEAKNLPKVGVRQRISAEGVLSLRPTLVLASTDAGPPQALEQIRNAGVPVVVIPDPNSIDAPAIKIRAVAQALGVPQRGETVIAPVQKKLDQAVALARTAKSKPRVLFLYLRGAGTQLAAGANTQIHALIEAAGAINAAADSGMDGFKAITAEAMVAARPDILIVNEIGLESVGGLAGLQRLPGVALTPAAQQRRILVFDDTYLLSMGPRTGDSFTELVLAIHPELKGGR